uniref:Uncharacterized protein n=1 Tax=Anguilla anguilla TaxID=7936 RepID=A0A0E9SLA3_ANGAN
MSWNLPQLYASALHRCSRTSCIFQANQPV